MSNSQSDLLGRIRRWADRWNSTISIALGLVGIPGLLIAAYGLWLQYDQLIDAERDTAKQFEIMTETLSQIEAQTSLQVERYTREASERFFNLRDDQKYEDLFAKIEALKPHELSEDERKEMEDELEIEFQHFQSTWDEINSCKEPYCSMFDLLHEHNVRDICTIASRDARRLFAIVENMPDIDGSEMAYDRVRLTPLGTTMCHCPSDWTSWGTEMSPFCWKFGRE